LAIASAYGHAGKWNGDVAANHLEDVPHERFDHGKHRLRPRERHFDVDLRELGLAVGTKIFVAEALADLHISIDAGNHQNLLEQLR
jgi:hypothetical protein